MHFLDLGTRKPSKSGDERKKKPYIEKEGQSKANNKPLTSWKQPFSFQSLACFSKLRDN